MPNNDKKRQQIIYPAARVLLAPAIFILKMVIQAATFIVSSLASWCYHKIKSALGYNSSDKTEIEAPVEEISTTSNYIPVQEYKEPVDSLNSYNLFSFVAADSQSTSDEYYSPSGFCAETYQKEDYFEDYSKMDSPQDAFSALGQLLLEAEESNGMFFRNRGSHSNEAPEYQSDSYGVRG